MFIDTKNKKWMLGCVLLSILLIYGLANSIHYTKNKNTYSELKTVASTGTTSASKKSPDNAQNDVNLLPSTTVPQSAFRDERQIAEVEDWRASRGYSSYTNEYGSYSESILLDLAKNGDIRALTILGERRYRTHGFNAAEPYYMEAAARGSTEALLRLATIEGISHYLNAKSQDEKRRYSLKILAIGKAASLRGDQWIELSDSNAHIKNNKITLNETDKKLINEMAAGLYNSLQKQRYELGLGEFDDSVPDSVKSYFDSLERDNKIIEKYHKVR